MITFLSFEELKVLIFLVAFLATKETLLHGFLLSHLSTISFYHFLDLDELLGLVLKLFLFFLEDLEGFFETTLINF